MYLFRKEIKTKNVCGYKIISLNNHLPLPMSDVIQDLTLINNTIYDAFNTIENNPGIEYVLSSLELSTVKPECPFIELDIPETHFWWSDYNDVGLKLYQISDLQPSRLPLPYYSPEQQTWFHPLLECSNADQIAKKFSLWHDPLAKPALNCDDTPYDFSIPIIEKNTKKVLSGEIALGLALMRNEKTIPCIEIDLNASALFDYNIPFLEEKYLSRLKNLNEGFNLIADLRLSIFKSGTRLYPWDDVTKSYFTRFGFKKNRPNLIKYHVIVENKDQIYRFIDNYSSTLFKKIGLITSPRCLFRPLRNEYDDFSTIVITDVGFLQFNEHKNGYDRMNIYVPSGMNIDLNKWFKVISKDSV